MTIKMRARIVAEWTYDADPAHYGTTDPETMARLDKAGYEGDPEMAIAWDSVKLTVTVEPEADSNG